MMQSLRLFVLDAPLSRVRIYRIIYNTTDEFDVSGGSSYSNFPVGIMAH